MTIIKEKLLIQAAQLALDRTAKSLLKTATEVIEEVGAFPDFPDSDIVLSGATRDSGQVVKTDTNTRELRWTEDYDIYVHEGYTLRNGRKQEGRAWTKEAIRRKPPQETFNREFEDIVKRL